MPVMTRVVSFLVVLLSSGLMAQTSGGLAVRPFRVAIAGLAHGHVDGFLRALAAHSNVELVGVADPDAALRARYAAKYRLDAAILFADTAAMLDKVQPEAVATFTSTFEHAAVVEACAARKTPVMMEKPLAVSMEHARAIERAAKRSGIPVIVNYETTWYASHAALWRFIKEQKAGGEIRKMVAMDGHEGPKEIGVGPEFLSWLTDPVKNGAGALFDFGCYGANLMTWLMDNQRPVSVVALTERIKPAIYPKVDDEANILVEYPRAVGIIQGSWNWPTGRKDLEVYAERASAIATGGASLRVRSGNHPEEARKPEPLEPDDRDSIAYLISVVRGRRDVVGLSSLENNLIVTEILTAARESARTGRKVMLGGR
ncbi:MAG: Gfo/Idh/MocA family oxidoreductase [Acidobacteria bacterium]|nr:Gfo/Idh/MocA family oxidoreductase [Acidobacteriota bacterium]